MSEKLWRVGQKELDYIKEAIDSGLTGVMNQKFESKFATKMGVKYAVGVNSGTSALHSCLGAMEIGPGDEVIVPPLTFASTAFSVMYLGGIPVFADIDPDTFNINYEDIENKITNKTKAIIPVSLYGLPAEMDPIMEIAEKNDIFVLEDCAQCFLGKYKGKTAGTIGHMGIFSFERSKHMTTGNGGMLVTNDKELAEKARKFSILGYSTLKAGAYEAKPPKEIIQDPNFERHLFVSPNYRLPEVCAAMGLAQLEQLDIFVDRRIKIAKIYSDAVGNCEWLCPQKTPEYSVNSYFTYAMKLESLKSKISWSQFRETYLKNGGDSYYAAWKLTYTEPAIRGMKFENGIEYKNGLCPIAEDIQPKMIQLKTNYESLDHAKEQAEILRQTIGELDKF
ncbi:DegT/DnrJ/EryC1/StrS family aminotransferase [uncultured Methanomethylovorans sp.]|uniref:DegT/DnrJ/EryC1/StrS family aminotransferase n=1 Tax=uncultured Methanomethylovorans sp. TaxID=183759 RepID=UPI002AA6155C|nr:DegT/DnrJ/EryC1/StrS family aminotransferase [uncultured Methanomethylovorans sp.]